MNPPVNDATPTLPDSGGLSGPGSELIADLKRHGRDFGPEETELIEAILSKLRWRQ